MDKYILQITLLLDNDFGSWGFRNESTVMHRIYEYRWSNNPTRLEMKGRKCVGLKPLKNGVACFYIFNVKKLHEFIP